MGAVKSLCWFFAERLIPLLVLQVSIAIFMAAAIRTQTFAADEFAFCFVRSGGREVDEACYHCCLFRGHVQLLVLGRRPRNWKSCKQVRMDFFRPLRVSQRDRIRYAGAILASSLNIEYKK